MAEQQKEILTTTDIVKISGITMQKIQDPCRTGRLPCTNISMGTKKARYIIRRCDWEAFITPKQVQPLVEPETRKRRQRLDVGVERVFG